jgi:hypothetical protein
MIKHYSKNQCRQQFINGGSNKYGLTIQYLAKHKLIAVKFWTNRIMTRLHKTKEKK